jgi:hypothetical protein
VSITTTQGLTELVTAESAEVLITLEVDTHQDWTETSGKAGAAVTVPELHPCWDMPIEFLSHEQVSKYGRFWGRRREQSWSGSSSSITLTPGRRLRPSSRGRQLTANFGSNLPHGPAQADRLPMGWAGNPPPSG